MPVDTVALSPQEQTFSPYPVNMDSFFERNTVIIKVLPDGYIPSLELSCCNFQVTSAAQYKEYLDQELSFWTLNDSKKLLAEYTKVSSIDTAIKHFNNALTSYKSTPHSSSSGDSHMKNSVGAISAGTISCKTALATFMVNNIDKGAEFFKGLKYGLSTSKTTSFSASVGVVEGLAAALEYRAYIEGVKTSLPYVPDQITESVTNLGAKLADITLAYTKAFHEQEQRLASIAEQANSHFAKMEVETKAYFADKDKRCAELEALYTEKLRLKAPAEHWQELEKEYARKGGWWLAASIALAVLVIVGLIALLMHLPNMFTEDSHWFDIFKNSAIVTIVASVAIYILHLFVKLGTSAIHLSRDAKERNKLTYFYLALIEGKAVTEKERAIILNSLFSRSDTGLLKGDSAPTMSATLADLVERIQPK